MSADFEKTASSKWLLVDIYEQEYRERVTTETKKRTVGGIEVEASIGYIIKYYVISMTIKKEGVGATFDRSIVGKEVDILPLVATGPGTDLNQARVPALVSGFAVYHPGGGFTQDNPKFTCVRDRLLIIDHITGHAINEQVWEYRSPPTVVADSTFWDFPAAGGVTEL